MIEIANRVKNIEESKSIGMARIVEELKREGKKIISLSVGEPDFPTPSTIIAATKNALDQGHTRYSLVSGVYELRQEIAQWLMREKNFPKIGPEHILLSNGSKHSLYNIFQAICNPNDEVIVPCPYWVTIPESIKLAGGVPVIVDTDHLQLDLKKMARAITAKTKAIVINSPNNPSGMCYPEKDLHELASLAKKHNLTIISDEAYEALVFDNGTAKSIATLSPEIFERTISVQTFSKSFCMTGFRLGFIVAPPAFIKNVDKLQGHMTGNNCTFSQYGALAALKMPTSELQKMNQIFENRRNLSYELCCEIFECLKPQGAFYLFPSIKKYLQKGFSSDDAFCEFILKEAQVAILPGTAFGMPGHVRISFAASEKDLTNAFLQMKSALKNKGYM